VTLALLQQLSTLAATANQTWSQIGQKSNGVVNPSPFNFLSLKGDFDADIADVQSLMSGSVSQISLGQYEGQNIYLDLNGLALLDRFYFAYFVGSGAVSYTAATLDPKPRADDTLTEIQNSLASYFSNELPSTIRANSAKLRTIGSIGIAVGALVLSGPAATAAIGIGAVLWGATVLVPAAFTVVSETAGAAITGNPPSLSDFQNTAGIFKDGYWDAFLDFVKGKIANWIGEPEGDRAAAIVTITTGIDSLMNPGDPTTPAGEAANDLQLFNQASSSPLDGNWTGTYNRTPAGGCPSFSGSMTASLSTDSSNGLGGTFTIGGVPDYQGVSGPCDNPVYRTGEGNVLGQVTGLDANGNLTFLGSLQGSLDGSLTSLNFQFSATLVNGAIQGVFTTGRGDFTLASVGSGSNPTAALGRPK
jgi:hypothetical protein